MIKQKMLTHNVYLLLIILLCFGCKKGEDNGNDAIVSPTSQILISPDDVMINEDETGKIFISVQPPVEVEWNVSTKPNWIDISPSSGILNNEIVELQITPKPDGLEDGKHRGEIEIITSGAGKARVSVVICIAARPIAKVEQTEMVYGENETEKMISITNIGTGFLNWELQSLPEWINVSQDSGILDEQQNIQVRASAIRGSLPVGIQTAQALLSSNSDEGDININFSLEVAENPLLSTSIDSLKFGYFEDTKSFYIKNEGNVPFDWNLDNNNNILLNANPSNGTLEIGAEVEITVTLDRTNLLSGIHDLDIIISNNKGVSFAFPTRINHFKEEKWLVNGRIIDAEYDRNNDVIIVVSENPDEIRKFNPVDNSSTSLSLTIPPKCVSLSQDGNYAVVGHNGSFNYIDLNEMKSIDTYAVTTNAFDIVIAPNDFVYVFPEKDQWETIRCVNLITAVETEHIGRSIYDETRAKLHPSGNYIYGANNGLSPSDFEKYDISDGTAKYLYDSPYHGDFDFYGDLWISEDGNRLFAKSRSVFNASTNENNDMTYSGELAGEGRVMTLDFSRNAEKIYAVFTTDDFWDDEPGNEVRIYETEFLAFQGTIKLPGFFIPDGSGDGVSYPSEGHFGFFNSMGTAFYVLVKAKEGSGMENEWAIVTVEVE